MKGIEELDIQSIDGNDEHRFQYNGKEKEESFGLYWNDHGARSLDVQLGRWNGVDPLAEKFVATSSYVSMNNNPVLFVDFDGREVRGTTTKDARKIHEDLNEVFSGKQFDQLRNLFTRGNRNNRKSFDEIDEEALKEALSGLEGDDLALAQIVTGAINSDKRYTAEYAELDDELSYDAKKGIDDLITYMYESNGQTAPDYPSTRTGKEVKALGGSGFNVSTSDGSHSIILEGEGVMNTLGRRVLDTFHEMFGHGIATGNNVSNEDNNTNAIQLENLVRRVLGIEEQRDGSNHSGGKIDNPSTLPSITK